MLVWMVAMHSWRPAFSMKWTSVRKTLIIPSKNENLDYTQNNDTMFCRYYRVIIFCYIKILRSKLFRLCLKFN